MGYPVSSQITQSLAKDSWTPVGDIVDPEWHHFLRYPSGKPHSQAVAILARIIYMYRPTYENVIDPESGLISEVRLSQKFKADLWQASRQSLADTFGFTLREVDSALNTLRESKVIYTELRSLIVHGVKLSNVLYIGLNIAKLKEISTPITFKRYTSNIESTEVLQQKALPLSAKSKTDTKTSLETPLETTTLAETNKQSSSASVLPSTVKSKINIPESILYLIPENKRNDKELSKVHAALLVSSEEVVIFNITRALTKAKKDDPWGMVAAMLVDLALNNCDWYSADRQRLEEKGEKTAAARRKREKEDEAAKAKEKREARERNDRYKLFLQLPADAQQVVQNEANRRVELFNPDADSIALVITDVILDIKNGIWEPPEPVLLAD